MTAQADTPRVFILNGANTNLYGQHDSGTYGTLTLDDIKERCLALADHSGVEVEFRQTNHEGVLIDWIQEAGRSAQGIVINAGSLSYGSIGILDALAAFQGPVIEVHMSNIHRREPFRHQTYTSKAATGSICGLGADGYEFALLAVLRLIARERAE